MRGKKIRGFTVLLVMLILGSVFLTACGGGSSNAESGGQTSEGGTGGGAFAEIAGDYYLDLNELGMALVMYLRLSDDGTFLFSDSTAFESEKSSGTFESSSDGYIMLYDMVNGEEKTITDGLTSSFVVADDGSLDFSGTERIYYGSASVTGKSVDDPDAKLMGILITDDFEEPNTASEFKAGSYTAQSDTKSYTVSFYEDDTYFLMESYDENGTMMYMPQTGIYGISTAQIALTPDGGDRLSGEVISSTEITIPMADDPEGEGLTATKQDSSQSIATLKGQGSDGSATFDVTVTIYSDGTYTSEAGGFTEGGVFVQNSSTGEFKTYPDHPETGVRGLAQIATVPAGTFTYTDGKLTLTGFRVRNSENLTRYECEVTQQ